MNAKIDVTGRSVGVAFEGDAVAFVTHSHRPKIDARGMVTNSILDKREWAQLDAAVIAAAKLRLNGVADLRAAGLTQTATLATMLSQWRVASEKVAASVSMDGASRGNEDRVDLRTYGVPVPIIHSDYRIPLRQLLASQRLGEGLDVTEASESAQAVVEKQEQILFNGQSPIVVGTDTIYGYTTLAARLSDTAANFGGGDFGTISNIYPTFVGMISGLAGRRYHGPFVAYVASTQYTQMLERFSDGSGQMALDAVLRLPQITAVKPADVLADGNVVLVQLTPNVVDLIIALELENREWMSNDGSVAHFKVMASMAPRLKTDYNGYTGIAHATGA